MKKLFLVVAIVIAALGLNVVPAYATQTIHSGYLNLANGCQTYWQQTVETSGSQVEVWSYSLNSCQENVVLRYYNPAFGYQTTTSPWVAAWAERYCSGCTLIYSDHNFRAWCGTGFCTTAYGYRKYWP